MVPGRHGLHHIPQQRRRRHAVGGHSEGLREIPSRAHAILSSQIIRLLLQPSQRRPQQLFGPVQAVAAHERAGADEQLRDGLGLVLLDLDHGERHPVGL